MSDETYSPLHTVMIPNEGKYHVTGLILKTECGATIELTNRVHSRPFGRNNTEVSFEKARVTGEDE